MNRAMKRDHEYLMNNNRLGWTAHHEAAHAIAFVRLGLPCSGVSIIPSMERLGALGIEDSFKIVEKCDDAGNVVPDALMPTSTSSRFLPATSAARS